MRNPFELFVGLRYVRARNRRGFISFISLISMLGIAIAVAVLIVVLSVMNGFERELRERILDLASHAAITGYDGALEDWTLLRDVASADERVEAVAAFSEGQAMLLSDARSSGVALRGITPAQEQAVASLGKHMRSGRLEDLVAGQYGLLIGQTLADELQVGVGEKVLVMVPQANVTPAGVVPRMRRFTISGIFSAGMHEYDRGLVFAHLKDAQALYRMGNDVTGLRLRLTDMFEAPRAVRDIALELGGGVYITDWTRQHSNFFRSIKLTKTVMFVILLLVVAVAAFNIVSTLYMVVKDKSADIAIMRTIGASPGSITRIFVVQGIIIGVIGVLLGLFLGVTLALNLEDIVRWLEATFNTTLVSADVYYISDLPAQIRPGDLIRICTTALLLTLLSTLYPAWRASLTQPAEALRHE